MSTKRTSSLRRRSGFTLVELVMAIVLVGILATVAFPTLNYLDEIRYDGAISMTMGHLRYARYRSMSSRLRTWIVFDTATESYTAYIEDAGNLGKANRIALTDPLTRAALSVTLDDSTMSGVDLSAVNINSGVEIEFDSLGTPYDSTSTALTANGVLTFGDGNTIVITAETGHVGVN